METGITLKVWKTDYSFLIKNYLNPEMWEKTWTLFEYKEYKVTMNLYSIKTKDQKLWVEIKTWYTDYNGIITNEEQDIEFSLKIEDITFLKRQINSAIFNTMCLVEQEKIKQEQTFIDLINKKWEEARTLTRICNTFLDNNNITNDNIRSAYIDAYIDEYAQIPTMMNNYVSARYGHVCTDLFLIWLSTLTDDPKKELRTMEIQNRLTSDEYNDVKTEIDEYLKYMETEEFEEDIQSNLEEV